MNLTIAGEAWKPVYSWSYKYSRWLRLMWQRPNGGITGMFRKATR